MEGTGNKNFMEYVRFMRQALFDIPEAVQQDGEIKGNLTQGILRKWMDSVHNSATAQSIHIVRALKNVLFYILRIPVINDVYK